MMNAGESTDRVLPDRHLEVTGRQLAIEALLAVRQEFAGMDFNLTDEVVRMREMEDE